MKLRLLPFTAVVAFATQTCLSIDQISRQLSHYLQLKSGHPVMSSPTTDIMTSLHHGRCCICSTYPINSWLGHPSLPSWHLQLSSGHLMTRSPTTKILVFSHYHSRGLCSYYLANMILASDKLWLAQLPFSSS